MADKQTFRIMDSLFAFDSPDKDFYFSVFTKILQTADGALSEHVSTIASKYYLRLTNHFIPRAMTMDATTLDKWIRFIAFDLYAKNKDGQKGLPKIKANLRAETVNNFVIASDSTINLLYRCNDKIYKETERLVKSD